MQFYIQPVLGIEVMEKSIPTRQEKEAKALKLSKRLFIAFIVLSLMFLIFTQTPLYAVVWAYSQTLVFGIGVCVLSTGLAAAESLGDSGLMMTKRKKKMLLEKAMLLEKEQQ